MIQCRFDPVALPPAIEFVPYGDGLTNEYDTAGRSIPQQTQDVGGRGDFNYGVIPGVVPITGARTKFNPFRHCPVRTYPLMFQFRLVPVVRLPKVTGVDEFGNTRQLIAIKPDAMSFADVDNHS
jgi:hypothetical protein